MITYADLKYLTSDEYVSTLPRAEDGKARADWWAARGVNYRDLERFCLEDGVDTFENVIPSARGVRLEAMLTGVAAMSVETGFMLGWLACERSRA